MVATMINMAMAMPKVRNTTRCNRDASMVLYNRLPKKRKSCKATQLLCRTTPNS